jgi:6-phosphofructokinase 1
VLARIRDVYDQRGLCTVIVAEGVREPPLEGADQGAYWAELMDGPTYDASGQRVFSMSAGASAYLVKQVQERLGLRCRQVKLNTAQRASRLLASTVDRDLAAMVGRAAVDAWRQGRRSVLPLLRREGNGWRPELAPLAAVAGPERTLPLDYIDAANYDVTDACRAYIAAVAGDLPPCPILWIA